MNKQDFETLIERVEGLKDQVDGKFPKTAELLALKSKDDLVLTVLALTSIIVTDMKNRKDH